MTDRSTTAKKWLKFETTEFNPKTGLIETHSQEEWIYIKNPEFKKLRK
tara:strand:+ start:4530 stop:4673 length:144 start_codon:yes stop_codon:yes gene_type:complete